MPKKLRPWTKEDVRTLKTVAREKTKTTAIARKLKRTEEVEHMATKEAVAKLDTRIDDLREEMIDHFEHADKQFRATHDPRR
jgi:hypothetical protein